MRILVFKLSFSVNPIVLRGNNDFFLKAHLSFLSSEGGINEKKKMKEERKEGGGREKEKRRKGGMEGRKH